MNSVVRHPNLLPRPRLLQKLQDATQHKLTIISAPPGYGKTVLASQFAAQSQIPIVWHTLERTERDLASICAGSIRALGQSLQTTVSFVTPGNYSPEEFTAYLTEFLGALSYEIIYVVDDVHHVEGAPGAEHWLDTFVTTLPSNCHLVLIGRVIPRLSLVELIAHQEVKVMSADDLRLSYEELRQLAADFHQTDHDHLHSIDKHLQGWPAGVMLALRPLPSELEQTIFAGQATPDAIFDALAESMLQSQPPLLRDFMLASSTLNRMTPDVLESVLGLHNSATHLETIWQRNLFVSKLDGAIVYHQLLRRFLQKKFQQINALKFIDLHVRAARWFEAEQRLDEAFSHYVEAEQVGYAHALADQLARTYFVQGKFETLLEWKTVLETVGKPSATVLYSCAMIHINRQDFALAATELTQAATLSDSRQDTLLLEIQIQQAHVYLRQGHVDTAHNQLTSLLGQLAAPTMVRGVALWTMSYVHLQTGQMQEAEQYLSEALPIYRNAASHYALSQLLQSLSFVYERLGRLREASACLQECIALLKGLHVRRELAFAYNSLGYYFYLGGDYHRAQTTYDQGLQLLRHIIDPRVETYLLWNIGDLQRDLGDFNSADRTYHRAIETVQQSDMLLYCSILLSLGQLKRWQSNWQEVKSLATEVLTTAHQHGLGLQEDLGHILLWSSDADGSSDTLLQVDAVLDNLRQRQTRIKLMGALILAAQAALWQSNHNRAEAYLREAVALTYEVGTAHLVAVELVHSPSLMVLYETLKEKGAVPQALKTLQGCYQQSPTDFPMTLSLRVLTLGHCVVFRNNKRILTSAWRSSTARTLFFYLLFHGAAHRDLIATHFWPESTLEKVRSNFHTSIRRIRDALGEEVIRFDDELYTINRQLHLWCDAFDFESLIEQAHTLSAHDARAEHLFGLALQLYKGDLLPEINSQWIQPLREKYRELYLDALMGLAACMRHRGDFAGAANVLKQGLTLDPYREDIHRLLLTCYADEGQNHKLRQHYTALYELLQRELDSLPEPATQQLYQKLIS